MVTQSVSTERRQRRTRAERREQTRTALLNSAQRLFIERGYHEVSVEEIALDAGVAERTLFRYFPSKALLVLDPFLNAVPEMLGYIRDRPAREPPYVATLEGLRDLGRAHPELLVRDAGLDWRMIELPQAERERVMAMFVRPLADTLQRRYRLKAKDRLRAEVWARCSVTALTMGMVRAAELQQTRKRRVPIGEQLQLAFEALDGQP